MSHIQPDQFKTVRGFYIWRWVRNGFLPLCIAVALACIVVDYALRDLMVFSSKTVLCSAMGAKGALSCISQNGLICGDRLCVSLSLLLSVALTSAGLVALHSLYMIVTCYYLVYIHPLEKRIIHSVCVIILICLFFVTELLSTVAFLTIKIAIKPFEIFSFGLLLISYLTLWRAGRISHATEPPPAAMEYAAERYFIWSDGLLSLLVATRLIVVVQAYVTGDDHPLSVRPIGTYLDVIIAISFALYIFSSAFVRIGLDAKANSFYQNYRFHINPRGLTLRDREWLSCQLFGRHNLVDFGSGNGARLGELLENLDIERVKFTSIVLVDKDGEYAHSLDERLSRLRSDTGLKLRFLHTGRLTDVIPETKVASVLYASHMIYDIRSCIHVIKLAAVLPVGSLMVLRITGATGLFRALSVMYSVQSLRASYRHSMAQTTIRELTERHHFKISGQVIFRQAYRIASPNAISNLCDWSEFRYGGQISGRLRQFLYGIKDGGIEEISNDDDVLVLEKEA